MVSSLLLVIALTAWPVPTDAGADAYAQPANWPAEPEWVATWPLLSFAPPGWSLSANEQGPGMKVDQAFSVTRGDPSVTIAVITTQVDLSDPLIASAWSLNAAEAPDAGDTNGNGRLDVNDFVADPRVTDVNLNGALDLEDVARALADGLDQDGNGRADDLCGWDFDRSAPLSSTRDAGSGPWRTLVAPVNDGLEGIGACPHCTLVPFVDRTLTGALVAARGARVVLVPHFEDDLSAALSSALDGGALVITPGSGTIATFPLALEPTVSSPRTLTASTDRTTASSRTGCGGRTLGTHSVSTSSCEGEAATRLAGIAALVFSASPGATAAQVSALLGGERVDAAHAVNASLPQTLLSPARGLPSTRSPHSNATSCGLDRGAGEEPIDCDGGVLLASVSSATLDADPSGAFVHFIERLGPYTWSTPLASPPADSLRGLIGIASLGAGSGPPRYVDLDGSGSEAVVVTTPSGLAALGSAIRTPALSSGRLPSAIGPLEGTRAIDFVTLGDDGVLQAHGSLGMAVSGFPRQLGAPPAGPPVLVDTFTGLALVTVEVDGHFTQQVGETRWTTSLPAPQRSSPAAGHIDGDDFADFATANGTELHVLITDARGPSAASWSAPSRATEALLGNLVGDARLEIVAERVFDATGEPLLTLENWAPGVVPSALARIDQTSARALLQVEKIADGTFELARYDVERALRAGDSLVARQRLGVVHHVPARGGFAVADVTGDGRPDVLLPTEDGLLFVIDGEGNSPPESPLPTHGTVLSAPAVGVRDDQLEFAVRTTRGDVVRWLGHGLPEDISWESALHDRANTRNAETKLPTRRLGGLGITEPPIIPRGCSCGEVEFTLVAGLVFLFRRRRRTC